METLLRAALVGWLRDAPELAGQINSIEEESPLSTSPPWLGIAASASTDWSTKDMRGREVRIALELNTRGDDTAGDGALVAALDRKIEALPESQDGFVIVNTRFLRARAERRARNLRTVLLEYQFRLLETPSPLLPE